MSQIYYPKADRTSQWFAGTFPGTLMSDPLEKLLWHTTEGSNWPSYERNGVKGSVAPQVTYHARAHAFHQHFPINRSARALQDPQGTSVKENRDGVVQVEIVASADRAYAAKHGLLYIADLDEQSIDDLGEFSAWLKREWGVPLEKAPIWLPYPASYGNSDARMTSAEYNAFRGHLGHMHASGNSHGDPGAFPIDRVLAAARGTTPGKDDDDVALTDAERQNLGKAAWLADQWAQGSDFDRKLDKAGWLADGFAADGHITGKLDGLTAAVTALGKQATETNRLLQEISTKLDQGGTA